MKTNNKEEIINSLSLLFENHLSDPGRKAMIGKKIDDILSKYFNRISSAQLASALLSKYGVDLFNPKYQILEQIINRLKEEQAKQLAAFLGIDYSPNLYEELVNRANKKSNLQFFLDYFNQPHFYLKSNLNFSIRRRPVIQNSIN